jgi:hypothetical protein
MADNDGLLSKNEAVKKAADAGTTLDHLLLHHGLSRPIHADEFWSTVTDHLGGKC